MSQGTVDKGSGKQDPGSKDEKKGLSDPEKGWLGRYLGTRVPWKTTIERDGVEMDATEAYEELKQFEKDMRDGVEFEGSAFITIDELRDKLSKLGIPSVIDKAEDFAKAREKKDAELKKMRELIELQKQEIAEKTTFDVKVKRGTIPILTKTVKSKDGGRAEKEFDKEHYKGRIVQGPSAEQLKALDFVIDQLVILTENLRKNEEVSFSPNELMDEIWTPLVREQIISEHQCPSEFSRIIQLWQGATKLYNERLKAKAREEEVPFGNIRDALEDVDQLLGIGAAVADVVLTALGTGGQSKEILKLVSKCARAGVQLTSNVLAKNFEGAAGNVGDVLAATIPEPFGDLSKGAFLATVNVGLIAKNLAERNNEGAAEMFGKAISNAFSAIAAGTDNDVFKTIGENIEKSVTTAIKGKAIITLLQAEPIDTKAVLDKISEIATNEIQRGVSLAISQTEHAEQKKKLEGELDEKIKSGEMTEEDKKEELKKLSEEQDGFLEDVSSATEPLSDITSQFTALMKDKGLLGKVIDPESIEKAALEMGADERNAQMEQSQAEYTKRMAVAFGVGLGADEEDSSLIADLYDIDKLIAQIEADRAQLQLLSTVLDAVGGVIALIVPQLGGIVKAKQFAMNVVAAVRRSQELVKFVGLLNDAKKATSPQAHSLLAQVDELERQLTSDIIDAALHLGQGIAITAAAACELSGIGAAGTAAGRAVAGGLQAAEEFKKFWDKKKKESKVKRAWQRYRAALENPEDRIGIMKAIRSNPTLAKYAIAYGALEMGDPFAKEALRQCGLNDMTLAQEKTNADKVVQFLEVKFSDDIQVVGVVTKFAPDSGDPLTSASWLKNKIAAQNPKNNEILSAAPTNNIDKSFLAVDKSGKIVADGDIADSADFGEWTTHKANLEQLQVALLAFKPEKTDATEFELFAKYLSELAFAVGNEAKRIQREIDEETMVRDEAKKIHEQTTKDVDVAVKALADLKVAILAPTTPLTIDQMLDLCLKGEALRTVINLKKLAQSSPSMNESVVLVSDAVNFAGKRTGAAKKLAEGSKAQEAQTKLQEAITEVGKEFDFAIGRLNAVRRDAQFAIQQATTV